MSTGNRCVIYDRIDELGEARTVAELVQMLRPILQELAYYGVTGEAAVLEAHEEWHDTYTRRLRSESEQASASVATSLARAPMRAEPPARHSSSRELDSEPPARHSSSSSAARSRDSSSHSSSRDSGAHAAARAFSAHSAARASEPPSSRRAGVYTPARINGSGLSQGLMSIMTGRHPSLGRDA